MSVRPQCQRARGAPRAEHGKLGRSRSAPGIRSRGRRRCRIDHLRAPLAALVCGTGVGPEVQRAQEDDSCECELVPFDGAVFAGNGGRVGHRQHHAHDRSRRRARRACKLHARVSGRGCEPHVLHALDWVDYAAASLRKPTTCRRRSIHEWCAPSPSRGVLSGRCDAGAGAERDSRGARAGTDAFARSGAMSREKWNAAIVSSH